MKCSGNKFQILRIVRCNWFYSNMFFLLHFVSKNTFKKYSRPPLLQYSHKIYSQSKIPFRFFFEFMKKLHQVLPTKNSEEYVKCYTKKTNNCINKPDYLSQVTLI